MAFFHLQSQWVEKIGAITHQNLIRMLPWATKSEVRRWRSSTVATTEATFQSIVCNVEIAKALNNEWIIILIQ